MAIYHTQKMCVIGRGNMVRINAILSEDILVKIDAIAKEKKKSRSSFLREAAEKLIDEYQRQKAEEVKRERVKRSIEIQNKLKKKSGKWNGVSEVRKWRELHE